jgi:hypothetical protein
MVSAEIMDIAISLVLGFVTVVMGYLGIHLTMNPAKSRKSRNLYRAAFLILAFAAVGLNTWQTHRNSTAQKSLETKLDQVRLQQQHTHIRFQTVTLIVVDDPSKMGKPIPFRPKMQTGFNVYYQNVGTAIAKGSGIAATLKIVNTEPNLDEIFLDLRKYFKPEMRRDDLVPQESKFFTVKSDVLSEKDVRDITKGDARVFIIGVARFSDATGEYEQGLCRWLQPPGTSPVWHACAEHNQEIRLGERKR